MKWLKRIGLSLLAIVLLALVVIYAWSSVIINHEYVAETRQISLSSDPQVIAHGKRIAQVFGCFFGCHGEDMEGEVFFEGWAIGRIISPNLTRAMNTFSPAELEAIIRQGIRPDGTSVLGMPSASFATMTDDDLSAVLSFIASYPQQDQDLGHSSYGLMPRTFLAIGEFTPAAAEVEAKPWNASELAEPPKLGEYLAMNACSECHGMDLKGQDGFTPDLVIAQGYPLDDFSRLMSTGLGVGDRDLGLMSVVAKYRFSKMTPNEQAALHEYLLSR